jgi:hypothetical protein
MKFFEKLKETLDRYPPRLKGMISVLVFITFISLLSRWSLPSGHSATFVSGLRATVNEAKRQAKLARRSGISKTTSVSHAVAAVSYAKAAQLMASNAEVYKLTRVDMADMVRSMERLHASRTSGGDGDGDVNHG